MLSATDLSTYHYCKRKLFLQKVLKLREPIKDVMVLGTIRHNTLESINNQEQEIVESITKNNSEVIFEKYKAALGKALRNAIVKQKFLLKKVNIPLTEAFQKSWAHIIKEAQRRTENITQNIETHNKFGKELWQVLTPKLQSEQRIQDTILGVRGIIDQLEIYPDKTIPIELKTGSTPKEGTWPSHKIQLAAYMMMLEPTHTIKVGYIHYLDSDERRPIILNPFLKEEIHTTIKEANELLTSISLPDFVENKNKCTSCGLQKACYGSLDDEVAKLESRNL